MTEDIRLTASPGASGGLGWKNYKHLARKPAVNWAFNAERKETKQTSLYALHTFDISRDAAAPFIMTLSYLFVLPPAGGGVSNTEYLNRLLKPFLVLYQISCGTNKWSDKQSWKSGETTLVTDLIWKKTSLKQVRETFSSPKHCFVFTFYSQTRHSSSSGKSVQSLLTGSCWISYCLATGKEKKIHFFPRQMKFDTRRVWSFVSLPSSKTRQRTRNGSANKKVATTMSSPLIYQEQWRLQTKSSRDPNRTEAMKMDKSSNYHHRGQMRPNTLPARNVPISPI